MLRKLYAVTIHLKSFYKSFSLWNLHGILISSGNAGKSVCRLFCNLLIPPGRNIYCFGKNAAHAAENQCNQPDPLVYPHCKWHGTGAVMVTGNPVRADTVIVYCSSFYHGCNPKPGLFTAINSGEKLTLDSHMM